MMIWEDFAARGAEHVAVIKSSVYHNIREECEAICPAAEAWLKPNDPKHSSKSTLEWLKLRRMRLFLLQASSYSSDLNLPEMLW